MYLTNRQKSENIVKLLSYETQYHTMTNMNGYHKKSLEIENNPLWRRLFYTTSFGDVYRFCIPSI